MKHAVFWPGLLFFIPGLVLVTINKDKYKDNDPQFITGASLGAIGLVLVLAGASMK